jgi:hypothetical protein
MHRCHALAAAVLLAAPGLACAQVYRCVDAQGRVQYSQTKPADKNCEGVESSGPPPIGADGGGLSEYSKQLDKARGEEAKTKQGAEMQQKQQAYRTARCSDARAREQLLSQAGPLYLMDENGERHYQNDSQREALKARAADAVARECG